MNLFYKGRKYLLGKTKKNIQLLFPFTPFICSYKYYLENN